MEISREAVILMEDALLQSEIHASQQQQDVVAS
jgi:hypothetical protein